MVWGGRNLATMLAKELPTAENYGESWEVSDHPLHQSVIANGPLAGRTLHDLMQSQARDLVGPTVPTRFPWLFKFLDANDWLSVQVHPDDSRVSELWPGESGKTEAWFILAARPESRIYAGLLPGVGPRDFLRALAHGGVTELLHSFTPRAGDCVFLPAGTVHALGGGVVLAEIQQTSDATFRLFDWNRVDAQGQSRKLHIQEGLAAVDWNQGPVQPITVEDLNVPGQRSLVRCPYFHMDYLYRTEPAALPSPGTVQTLAILHGEASCGGETMTTGQVCLLPATSPTLMLVPRPNVSALLCTLPGTA